MFDMCIREVLVYDLEDRIASFGVARLALIITEQGQAGYDDVNRHKTNQQPENSIADTLGNFLNGV